MATRTDGPLIVRDPDLGRTDAEKAEQLRFEIAEKRNQMGRTVDAIEERLSPRNIKAQVTSVKNHVIDEIKDAKTHLTNGVSDGVSAAKQKVREATVGRVENMVHDVRHTVSEAGSTTFDTVKTNPIPAALVAVGLGWLIVSGMRSGRAASREDTRIRAIGRRGVFEDGYGGYGEGYTEGSYDRIEDHELVGGREGDRGGVVRRGRRMAGNVTHDVAERAKGVAIDAQEKVSEVASTVAHRADHLAQDARLAARNVGQRGRRVVRRAGVNARRAEQTVERQMRDNPVAFGALALALGAAVGLLLPHTEVEDRLIGEKKDRLLDTAKQRAESVAQQALSKVQEQAEKVTENLNGLPSSSTKNGYANGFSKHV